MNNANLFCTKLPQQSVCSGELFLKFFLNWNKSKQMLKIFLPAHAARRFGLIQRDFHILIRQSSDVWICNLFGKKRDLRTAWNISYVIERGLICAGGVWLIGSLHTANCMKSYYYAFTGAMRKYLTMKKKKKRKTDISKKKKNGMGAAGKSFKLSSSCFLAIFWSEAREPPQTPQAKMSSSLI